MLDPTICNGTNDAKIFVFGHEMHGQVSVVLDNLGKGASGAALQNMEIME
jgi:N-acetyl-gamma-glutamyl-phosphate reductase